MGDHQDRGRDAAEELLHPLDGGEVEVVGRLVEEHQVGVLEEQLGELEAAHLAAAQLPGVAALRRLVEAEAAERRAGPGLEVVAAEALVGVLRLAVARHRLAALLRQPLLERRHLRLQGGEVLARRHRLGEHRPRGRRWRLLGEVGEAHAAVALDPSGGGRGGAGDHLEERRLPRSVGADDREAVARLDAQVEPAEDGGGAEGDADPVEDDEGHQSAGGRWVDRVTAGSPSPSTPSSRSTRRTIATDAA